MNKALSVPKGDDVRCEAISALIKSLGIGKAAFFIRETMSQPVDYLKVKEQLFGNMTVADICSEIQRNQP
ncbi:hypothetical protein G7B40_029005 [Aetokthonos hydrillicola Thurmond2011]|jgi:hypothetical protein|uniref:Uncharacterized protein n=1 Tax=Aetokthonos hydrillicola Thurmond2011 TaxID=2712845 RepID=A0AAP5M7W0_9CYAN|nr:hypothetical protein [Aetokthonos hydrillicola]MBO3462357.1 hypothetical protein [Aetokthonos hydrillicola CCALA 1050]MBW4584226.1 hypothetical protein [Aetokthonos hydrillicola CCALA 1050]MDR9898566.1 hypothetical protein [Aetokthonos hydrillicola Thurmond2011]